MADHPAKEVYVGHDDDLGSVVIHRNDPAWDSWMAAGFVREQSLAWWEEHFGPLVAYGPTAVVVEHPCPTCGEHPDPLPESPGVAAIAAERAEQMGRHGWSADHDDGHTDLQLLAAAGAYLTNATTAEIRNDAVTFDKYPRAVNGLPWPWRQTVDRFPLSDRTELVGWRPSNDPRVALRRAGALIAAELDRLERMAARGIPLNEDDRLALWTPEMAACEACRKTEDGPEPCEEHRV